MISLQTATKKRLTNISKMASQHIRVPLVSRRLLCYRITSLVGVSGTFTNVVPTVKGFMGGRKNMEIHRTHRYKAMAPPVIQSMKTSKKGGKEHARTIKQASYVYTCNTEQNNLRDVTACMRRRAGENVRCSKGGNLIICASEW